jgi:hypothetical protein
VAEATLGGNNLHSLVGALLHMALMATWKITITCRDGSRLRFSEPRRSAPQKGEIVQTADAGQTIKARIDACHKEPPKAGVAPVFFQVMATEI